MLVPASHNAVARAAGEPDKLPFYGPAMLMQIAIDILGIAGIYYAQVLQNHDSVTSAVASAIPGYQYNNEDGAVRGLAQNLLAQMDANRGNHNTLTAGPVPVPLQAVGGQWTLSVRMEASLSCSSSALNSNSL